MIKNWHVYLVTEEKFSSKSTIEVVKEAIKGGVDVIQLRDKNLNMRERYEIGKAIKKLAHDAGVDFIVNNDVDLAMALDADGIHIGQEDLPIEVVRKLMGKDKIIGVSVSNLEEIYEAQEKGADYIGVGAIFDTNSKDVKKENSNLGLNMLRMAKEKGRLPIIAIGGINHDNAGKVITSGADCISVISAIASSRDIEKSTALLKEIIIKSKEYKNE
ncbi:thiamine phosphate synthase [Clostridiisalibacter paucivorans]|uniref:thiamine phosphate synthase n=1 Tax=Clostridiisalibacter paucivorans TaxID=408753 RepID=UPI00047D568F|nr:thiamine phosphate synthase [Clostridiisalibacter paucivorans]